jgi:protein required for attachment to host cells
MRTIWIVVADAARAQILSKVEGTDGLSAVQQLDNPLGRAHTVEIVTDHPGRFEKHGSNIRSAADPPTDPHEQKAREFAHQLNDLLNAAAVRGTYDMLALVAPAHFLGLLRSGMKPATRRRLVLHQANDLTRLSLAELQCHLGELLRFPYAAVART